ncbi:hypothetical protein LC593_33400 [Nostoc sp. CHAB 5844]|nr:hypothetical protein [Nostoc sp. CHAB 5844]
MITKELLLNSGYKPFDLKPARHWHSEAAYRKEIVDSKGLKYIIIFYYYGYFVATATFIQDDGGENFTVEKVVAENKLKEIEDLFESIFNKMNCLHCVLING